MPELERQGDLVNPSPTGSEPLNCGTPNQVYRQYVLLGYGIMVMVTVTVTATYTVLVINTIGFDDINTTMGGSYIGVLVRSGVRTKTFSYLNALCAVSCSKSPLHQRLFSTLTGATRTSLNSGFTHTPIIQTRSASSSLNPDYTHVIVGAGSAGCVLANRLTENPSNNVLLFEAGPKDTSWKIQMPAALVYPLASKKYNWGYMTEPQEHVNNRKMYWPRGKVWGGSSSINAMCYVRGHAFDYDRWQKEGAEGWAYADCLLYFKKAQNHQLGGNDYRGSDGPLNVSRGKSKNPLFEAFIQAGVEAGYPRTDDMNGYQQEGFGYMDLTVHNGVRWSTANAYLRDALKRDNLSIVSKSLVSKIVFEGSRAVGVQYKSGNITKVVRANKEVIVSSGAINSPQLLMLSGVGDADELKKHDIPIVAHVPGVGQNLQDHLELYVQQKCTKPITLYKAQWKFPHNMIRIGLQWFLTKQGDAATPHLESGAFIRSKPGVEHPDIQYHFLPSVVNNHGLEPGTCHAYQVHVGPMRALARGYIKLRSKDPGEHPIIQPNYLDNEQDRWEMRQCIKTAREVLAQKAFDEFRGPEINPGVDVTSEKDLDAYVREKSDTAYHPSCTCKMGSENDPMSVVDSKLKVLGVQNLRVVDASVMPSIVSGNLNAPTVMIAEKAADIIMNKSPLPRADKVPVYKPATLETQR